MLGSQSQPLLEDDKISRACSQSPGALLLSGAKDKAENKITCPAR
jgi:hypothetical protein